MEEEQVKREVWEGKVPVSFSVADEEVGFNKSNLPEPCYMLIPRVSYFPFCYDKLEKLFAKAVNYQPGPDMELWLSFEDMPLKWHYPVGVLYDLYGRNCRKPWTIIVHFKNFPEEDILHYQNKEAMEAHFKSKIKEADTLKHRTEVINSLTPQEFGQLWDGLKQCDFSEFWSVNRKLMNNVRGESVPFRHIPFCVYQEGRPPYQGLLSPGTSERENGDAPQVTLDNLLQLYAEHRDLPQDHVALIHGVEVPTVSPLQWLSEHFSYPDNFLYVCVVQKETE